MIIILDDDPYYVSWLARHRSGFVLDAHRRPTRRPAVLHRAVCEQIRRSPSRRTHWTTGRRMKACAQEVSELVRWSQAETGREPDLCPECLPLSPEPGTRGQAAGAPPDPKHLSHLSREIFEYVLEMAVLFLDGGQPTYDVTVHDIGEAVGKSPAQIGATLLRLESEGFLQIGGQATPGKPLARRTPVLPTDGALRTLPAFAQLSETEMQSEIRRLGPLERG